MAAQTGLPYAYDHFAEGESPDSLFLVFLFPYSNNFGVDGAVYRKIDALYFEQYTDRKDPKTDAAVEAVLDGYGIL